MHFGRYSRTNMDFRFLGYVEAAALRVKGSATWYLIVSARVLFNSAVSVSAKGVSVVFNGAIC